MAQWYASSLKERSASPWWFCGQGAGVGERTADGRTAGGLRTGAAGAADLHRVQLSEQARQLAAQSVVGSLRLLEQQPAGQAQEVLALPHALEPQVCLRQSGGRGGRGSGA